MNDLMKMRIFGLLSGTSQQVSNKEMQEVYDESIEQIRTVSYGNDYSTTYRILVASRNITTLRAGGKMRLKSCSYKRHWVLLEKVPIFATERVI